MWSGIVSIPVIGPALLQGTGDFRFGSFPSVESLSGDRPLIGESGHRNFDAKSRVYEFVSGCLGSTADIRRGDEWQNAKGTQKHLASLVANQFANQFANIDRYWSALNEAGAGTYPN